MGKRRTARGVRNAGRPRITDTPWDDEEKGLWRKKLTDHDSRLSGLGMSQTDYILSRAVVPHEYEVWVQQLVEELALDEGNIARRFLERTCSTELVVSSLGVVVFQFLELEKSKTHPTRKRILELIKGDHRAREAAYRALRTARNAADALKAAAESLPELSQIAKGRLADIKAILAHFEHLRTTALELEHITESERFAELGVLRSLTVMLSLTNNGKVRWEGLAALINCGARVHGVNAKYTAELLTDRAAASQKAWEDELKRNARQIGHLLRMFRGYEHPRPRCK